MKKHGKDVFSKAETAEWSLTQDQKGFNIRHDESRAAFSQERTFYVPGRNIALQQFTE